MNLVSAVTNGKDCSYFGYTYYSFISVSLLSLLNYHDGQKQKQNKNSMVLVRERTTPTERPPLVGEVIANFCG
jgi:hypothetical protein